jgi:hypothetical protein
MVSGSERSSWGARRDAERVLGMCDIAMRKSCAVGDARRWVCIEARTSDSSLSISFVELVARLYGHGPSPLTLLGMRSEHFESCRFDTIKTCQSQGSANALQQLSLCELRILCRRLDSIRELLNMV